MILHREELALARDYAKEHHFEGLTDAQMKPIMVRGRELFHWFKAHPRAHNAINLAVLVLLLGADYLILMKLPAAFVPPGQEHAFGAILLAAAVCGSLHSYLLYSLASLSTARTCRVGERSGAGSIPRARNGSITRASSWC
jgi:hypothetical protein